MRGYQAIWRGRCLFFGAGIAHQNAEAPRNDGANGRKQQRVSEGLPNLRFDQDSFQAVLGGGVARGDPVIEGQGRVVARFHTKRFEGEGDERSDGEEESQDNEDNRAKPLPPLQIDIGNLSGFARDGREVLSFASKELVGKKDGDANNDENNAKNVALPIKTAIDEGFHVSSEHFNPTA